MTTSRLRWRFTSCLAAASIAGAACASDASREPVDSASGTVASRIARWEGLEQLLAPARARPASRALHASGFRVVPREATARFEGAWYPDTADMPIRMATTGGPTVSIRRLGATAATASLHDGILVYAGAGASMDALAFSTRHGVEDLLLAHASETELGYQLDLPPSWRLHAPDGVDRLVEVRDAGGAARLRMWAREAWDADGRAVPIQVRVEQDTIRLAVGETRSWPVAIDPEWMGTDTMVVPRRLPRTTVLPDGRVLVSGGDESAIGLCETYDPVLGTFSEAGIMIKPRTGHTATLLPTGEVLMVGGGRQATSEFFPEIEVYDPASESFRQGANLQGERYLHTATLLPSGKVLITGGRTDAPMLTAELVDPAAESSTLVQPMATARSEHVAALLPSGRVLVTGGFDGSSALASSELFDPSSGAFVPGPSMALARLSPTATVLPSGRVLIAGGCPTFDTNDTFARCSAPHDSLEIFEPVAGAFQPAGHLATPRYLHGASLVASGRVMFAGGLSSGDLPVAEAEVYDPDTAKGEPRGAMAAPRFAVGVALLPTGKVLFAGGYDAALGPLDSAEVVSPESVPRFPLTMQSSRREHAATLLSTGMVLLAGGADDAGITSTCELFDPATALFEETAALSIPRTHLTASPLPSGEVLIAGGSADNLIGLRTTEIYDPFARKFRPGPDMLEPRFAHTATVLGDGRVLIAGGMSKTTEIVPVAEVFDPTTETFAYTGEMKLERRGLRETGLAGGRVLITGGYLSNGYGTRPEIYDPLTGEFTLLGVHMRPFGYHTATLLGSGNVLCVGVDPAVTAQLFDPVSNSFAATGPSTLTRHLQTAALLNDGRVLLAGGLVEAAIPDAELYDPSAGAFAKTGSMSDSRIDHTATTLKDGRVLVAGGRTAISSSPPEVPRRVHASAELYDPATGTFFPQSASANLSGAFTATRMPNGELLLVGADRVVSYEPYSSQTHSPDGVGPRSGHTATILRSGAVLLAGGQNQDGVLPDAWVYDAVSGEVRTAGMTHPRRDHTATVVRGDRVLLVGGRDDASAVGEAEWYDPQANAFQPAAALVTPRFRHAAAVMTSGRVLVASGIDADGNDLSSAELFDAAAATFESLGDILGPGPAEALPLPSGDVLVAGSEWACRFLESSRICRPVSETVSMPFSLSGSLSGVSILCGAGGCQFLDSSSDALWDMLSLRHAGWDADGNRDGATATAAGGDLVLVTPLDGIRLVPGVPAGVARPVIDPSDSDSALVAGREATLRGLRFKTQPTLSGGDSARPDVLPLVAFVPADAGHAEFGRVLRWTDTRIDWIPPTTARPGPGWIHVIVNAVPSVALFGTLDALPDGSSCESDAVCASGFCADQVCCDNGCTGACESCLASAQGEGGQDGLCRPVARGLDPKAACATDDPATCRLSGACDGSGACERYPDGADCGDGVCRAGFCRWCDGDVLGGSGAPVDCAPFTCRDAACLAQCTSAYDCARGHVCTQGGGCRPAPAFDEATDPGMCACRALPARARVPWLALLALGAACACVRRIRRR